MRFMPILIFVLIILTCSCKNKDLNNRDELSFNDSNDNVCDSLKKMQKMLLKIPLIDDNFPASYSFIGDSIEINNQIIGSKKSIASDTLKLFDKFSVEEKHDFPIMAEYLRKNFLSEAYIQKLYGLWIYSYKYDYNNPFQMQRSIAVLSDSEVKKIGKYERILDNQDGVYLFSHKDL